MFCFVLYCFVVDLFYCAPCFKGIVLGNLGGCKFVHIDLVVADELGDLPRRVSLALLLPLPVRLVVKVQSHQVGCVDPFGQRVEEENELELFAERLLFPFVSAGLADIRLPPPLTMLL